MSNGDKLTSLHLCYKVIMYFIDNTFLVKGNVSLFLVSLLLKTHSLYLKIKWYFVIQIMY